MNKLETLHGNQNIQSIPGISVSAPIRRSTPWAFIRKYFPFVPTIEMSTLFTFPSTNQINAQGAVTENPGTFIAITKKFLVDIKCIVQGKGGVHL